MTRDLVTALRALSPVWWGAVAGAAAAGATIVPESRVFAAVIGGGIVLAIALTHTACGCDEERPPIVPDLPATPDKVETWADWWRGAGAAGQQLGPGAGCGCA